MRRPQQERELAEAAIESSKGAGDRRDAHLRIFGSWIYLSRGRLRAAVPDRREMRGEAVAPPPDEGCLASELIGPDGTHWVMLSRQDYDAICTTILDLRAWLSTGRRGTISGRSPTLPRNVRDAIVRGLSPVRAWREYRQMTQRELAAAVGVSPAAIHYIEKGSSYGRLSTRSAIAKALRAPVWALDRQKKEESVP